LPKTTFRTKIGGGWARGASKNFGPPISATVEASNFKFGTQLAFGTSLPKKQRFGRKLEASNFKFGTQLGFWTSLPKNNVLDHNWRRSGLGEHPKKFVTPYVFATVEASNFKFSTQLGFASSLPKNNV